MSDHAARIRAFLEARNRDSSRQHYVVLSSAVADPGAECAELVNLTAPDLQALLNERDQLAAWIHPFGAWLTRLLRELDLGAADVAQASNDLLRVASINTWMRGHRTPTLEEAFQLANAIGAPLLDVLGAAGHGHITTAIADAWRREAIDTQAGA